MDASTAARLALAVAEVPPDALATSEVEADRRAPAPLVLAAADALRRSGQLGRARSLVLRGGVLGAPGGRAIAADVLRRAGETDHARRIAEEAIADHDDAGGRARATVARIALDAGRLDEARDLVAGTDAGSAPVAEVAALVAHRTGDGARALADVARGEAFARTPEERARLAAVRGYVLHATDPEGAFAAFAAAVEYAMRAGAVVEEATYRTGLAASAVDLGDLGVAITSARRAAVLWEVLGRPALAARALLACAAAHATARAEHETRAAAREAIDRAREGGDARAEAYAFWAIADALPAGEAEARAAAEDADRALGSSSAYDALRSAARLLRHGSDRLDAARRRAADGDAMDPAREVVARLEWWGARAEALVRGEADLTSGAARDDGLVVLQSLLALADAPAPVGARGPALFAGHELGARLGRSDAAGRLLAACREVARHLAARTPAELSSHVRALPWAAPSALGAGDGMKLEQAAELERILRTLADRERLGVLLDRVVDALVLWTGVERGLLLMRAPDGRLLPRAARNLARADLVGEQLALSHTLAARALETRAPVVAVDAAGELSSVVQSVHALKLRSVLALPLIARGEVLGVVYLDDRLRKGAFGPRELSWAQTIAQLAAVAILDARTNVLLRRAVRRAERASAELAETLAKREAEVDSLARELSHQRTGRATRHRYERIIGDSDPIQKLLALVDRVTTSDVPVLVFGESGSGKELLARAIHDNGPRAARPFVGENCGAIPESLLESALFGHVRGAFTGADRPRSGLFEVADRGTLFLDEIGEMSLGMQTKLLRVLEDGMVKPLGSERSRKVDVRVIAATHRDLEAMVKARTFREDLYYRLHIVALRIPPLRARPSDIPLLVKHFLEVHAKGADVRVTKAAMAKLLAFPWPGNVRQLENEIRRAIVLSDGVIDAEQLSPEVGGPTVIARVVADGLNVRDRIDALEVELVQRALERTRGNQTQAAKLLGLSRFGLQKMMKRLGVASSASASAAASEAAPS
jgi:transcriptional regulator with GAF, ATPase, and Fis domain